MNSTSEAAEFIAEHGLADFLESAFSELKKVFGDSIQATLFVDPEDGYESLFVNIPVDDLSEGDKMLTRWEYDWWFEHEKFDAYSNLIGFRVV